MLDADLISSALDQLADRQEARKRMKHLKPLRGLRGTPISGVTSVLVKAWKSGVALPRDSEALHTLFCSAWEDGLVAVGLAAACVPDAPHEVLDLAERWAGMVDDPDTADPLGWLVLGPGLLASGEPFADTLVSWRSNPGPHARRAAVLAAMAALPEPVVGPCAAALRERVGERHVAFVGEPMGDVVEPVVRAFIRDEHPHVRKALGRLLRAWGTFEPERAEVTIRGISGGIPRMLRDEAERGIRKGRRLLAAEDVEEEAD